MSESLDVFEFYFSSTPPVPVCEGHDTCEGIVIESVNKLFINKQVGLVLRLTLLRSDKDLTQKVVQYTGSKFTRSLNTILTVPFVLGLYCTSPLSLQLES